jgi:hypothetical protein
MNEPADMNIHPASAQYRWPALMIAIALVVRFAVEFAFSPGGGLEEAQNGNFAVGILDGLVASPWLYQYRPWTHGPLVFGLLLTPFYALFGSSMVWIKLLGGLFALGGIFVWVRIARRAWGPVAAAMLALWWLFPSEYITQQLHIVWANHMESILLSGLLAAWWVRWDEKGPSWRSALGMGALAGFATFFCLQNLVMSSAIAVAILWRWKAAGAIRVLLPGLLGFAIGYAPHMLFQAQIGYSEPAIELAFGEVLSRWQVLFAGFLPRVFGYGYAAFSAGAMMLVVAAAVFGLTRKSAKDDGDEQRALWLVRLLALYPVAYAFAFALSRFRAANPAEMYEWRYFLPLVAVGMALVAWLLSRVPKNLGWLILAPFIFVGVLGAELPKKLGYLLDRDREISIIERATMQRGDFYQFFVRNNMPFEWGKTPETFTTGHAAIDLPSQHSWVHTEAANREFMLIKGRAFLWCERLAPPWQEEGYNALGRWVGPERAAWVLYGLPENDDARRGTAFGAGQAWGLIAFFSGASDPPISAASFYEHVDDVRYRYPDAASAMVEGAGWILFDHYSRYLMDFPELAQAVAKGEEVEGYARFRKLQDELYALLNEPDRESFLFGIAKRIGRSTGPDRAAEMIEALLGIEPTPERIETFRRGQAVGLADELIAKWNVYTYPTEPDFLAFVTTRLAERGYALQPVAGRERVYTLERMQ